MLEQKKNINNSYHLSLTISNRLVARITLSPAVVHAAEHRVHEIGVD